MAYELNLDWVWEQAQKRKYMALRAGRFNLKISRRKNNKVCILMYDKTTGGNANDLDD
jgi:hypothetical protein